MYMTRYTDPEAVGWLVAEEVRCGKVNCRCRRGRRHGPYWYLYYRDWDWRSGKWRLRKRYVKATDVEGVRARLERTKEAERAFRGLPRRGRALRGAVRRFARGEIDAEEFQQTCAEANAISNLKFPI